MKRAVMISAAIAAMATVVSANPIPIPPPASMPLEQMYVEINEEANGLSVAFTGDFTFTYIPNDVTSMLFPVPPDAEGIRVWQDEGELTWHWSAEQYPTILPEMPTIPMIEWPGPFPEDGTVFTVAYQHDLVKRPTEYIFFYASGTGKYFPTYDKTTTAYFDILLPVGYRVAGVWLDYDPHDYEVVGSHLLVTVESHFGPITRDLIVSLVLDCTNIDFLEFAKFASRWLESDCNEPDWCGGADKTGDGTVDANDLQDFAVNWLECVGGTLAAKAGLSEYYNAYDNLVEPNCAGYSLPLDLNGVGNYAAMDEALGLEPIAELLEDNGFGVMEHNFPPDVNRYDIVEVYDYLNDLNVPVFVTSDTLLHLYHIQFDETLKDVEEREFYGDIRDLTAALLAEAMSMYDAYSADLKEAARRNAAYLAVAQQLIDPTAQVPGLVAGEVAAELAKIDAHAGYAPSDSFIYPEDYSQYVPRGHYTRSEELQRYFKTLMWYGRMAFLLKGAENWGPTGEALISVYDAKIQTMQAVLLAESIKQVQVAGRGGHDIWDRMYTVTAFYVGLADDLTPYEYLGAVEMVFGSSFLPTDLEDANDFFALKAELALLRSPRICGGTGNVFVMPPITPESLDVALNKTKGMRFMGQRFIPDSYMFQQLVFPRVRDYVGDGDPLPFTLGWTGASLGRCYPRGLDVMSVLGSSLAETILAAEGDTDYVDYTLRLNELKAEFEAFDVSDWNRNLYWGWLYSLRSLIEPLPEGYPNFVRTEAWAKKQLNAALASWTELRHDTILYAKQSYTPPGTGLPPPPPPGYVEPVPEFYGRLLALTGMTKEGLNDLNALSEQAQQQLDTLEYILIQLIEIANKQLTNQQLSEDDNEFISNFAEALEWAAGGQTRQGAKTTLVADVHTHSTEQQVLEEGVGYVDLIIAACPNWDGSIFLAAGPVLSYYEFKQPMNERLTDEAWSEMLDSPQRPIRPGWYQPLLHP
ncbi:MAG: DUF3160 domain-containing protein [Planctomycetota bacterium]|jgi:hypothetical protein